MLLAGAAYFLTAHTGDAAMTLENDQTYYQRRAEQQLSIASAAVDPSIKAIHLDLASRYATLRELAVRDDLENGQTMMAQIQVGIGR